MHDHVGAFSQRGTMILGKAIMEHGWNALLLSKGPWQTRRLFEHKGFCHALACARYA
jgi:hypothetical protein